jgi:hypothetical protein
MPANWSTWRLDRRRVPRVFEKRVFIVHLLLAAADECVPASRRRGVGTGSADNNERA